MSKRPTADSLFRAKCNCANCQKLRRVLRLLDDIACSPAMMGYEDIERLCTARSTLGVWLGHTYNEDSNRYDRRTK